MTGLDATMGQGSLTAVGEVAAAEAGWSDSQLAAPTQAYLRYLAKFHPRNLGAV